MKKKQKHKCEEKTNMNRNLIRNIQGRDSFEAVGDEEADLEETKTRCLSRKHI